jgi:hypothetical protein
LTMLINRMNIQSRVSATEDTNQYTEKKTDCKTG